MGRFLATYIFLVSHVTRKEEVSLAGHLVMLWPLGERGCSTREHHKEPYALGPPYHTNAAVVMPRPCCRGAIPIRQLHCIVSDSMFTLSATLLSLIHLLLVQWGEHRASA